MQSSQELVEAQDALSEQVSDSLGMGNDSDNEEHGEVAQEEQLPEVAKRKLGMQEKRHKKQMRQMQHQIEEMRSQMNSQNVSRPDYSQNYAPDMSNSSGDQHDPVYQAVARAMQLRDEQERQQKMAENKRYIDQQFMKLHENLDNASNKYEDFDDVVRDDSAPFTQVMTEMGLYLPNAEDVLYKLGKDRTNLERISKLHPVDQRREMVKLSHALMLGANGKQEQSSPEARPLGNIKSNPINPRGITENTSVSDLRKRMKNGWK